MHPRKLSFLFQVTNNGHAAFSRSLGNAGKASYFARTYIKTSKQ